MTTILSPRSERGLAWLAGAALLLALLLNGWAPGTNTTPAPAPPAPAPPAPAAAPIAPPADVNLCPDGGGVPVRSLYSNLGEEMIFEMVDPDGDPITLLFLRDGEYFMVREVNPARQMVILRDDTPTGDYYLHVRATDSGGATQEICVQIKVRPRCDFNGDGKVNLEDFKQFTREWSRLRKP